MLQSKENQNVPSVTFHTRQDNAWVDVTSNDIFAGKTVVVFSLPGAFTPTCSSAHVPRYEELAPAFKAAGVDDILCMSVNDGFVMHSWGLDQGVDAVRMIPDGNGGFRSTPRSLSLDTLEDPDDRILVLEAAKAHCVAQFGWEPWQESRDKWEMKKRHG